MPAGSKPSLPAARIHALPETVKNQIAAGEVVERPASVVKELLENALDAGGTEIQVDLEEGGARLVRITDNGCGMGPADLDLAFLSHATSKLRSVSDLEHIASLGFRGEALASIGSVSKARILSRPADVETGWIVENDGGRIGEIQEAGAPRGTTIEVRDLFYNTPARRSFLKRTATELARCLDVIQRLALAHIGVGFVVTHDKKRVFDVEARMGLRDRVRRIFGNDLADALEPVEAADGFTRLAGFVAPPRFSRGDTSRQMWFLNGRPLRDRVLTRVVRQAYHGFLVDNRQPVCFLELSMDPGLVDVNVHPTKSEVRFREERRLFGFLVNRLREAVARTDMATPGESLIQTARRRSDWEARHTDARGQGVLPDPGSLHPGASWPGGPSAPGAPGAGGGTGDGELRVFELPGRPFDPGSPENPGAPGAPGDPGQQTPHDPWQARDDRTGPYLQIDRTYIVRGLPDGFEIIDQHALHERLTYEGLRSQVQQGGVEIQRSLVPELVECSPADVKLLSDHLEALSAAGIELAVFGERTVAVHGLPALLRRPDPEGVVRDAIELLRRTGKAPTVDEVVEEVLHSAACRGSVMAGDELSNEDIHALLTRAAELESDQTCPHARPTRVKFTLADLEKAFHRR